MLTGAKFPSRVTQSRWKKSVQAFMRTETAMHNGRVPTDDEVDATCATRGPREGATGGGAGDDAMLRSPQKNGLLHGMRAARRRFARGYARHLVSTTRVLSDGRAVTEYQMHDPTRRFETMLPKGAATLQYTQALVGGWRDGHRRRVLIFTTYVKTAFDITTLLVAAGVRAAPYVGTMAQRLREVTSNKAAAGEIDVLVGTSVMAEGHDFSWAHAVILAGQPPELKPQCIGRMYRTGLVMPPGIRPVVLTLLSVRTPAPATALTLAPGEELIANIGTTEVAQHDLNVTLARDYDSFGMPVSRVSTAGSTEAMGRLANAAGTPGRMLHTKISEYHDWSHIPPEILEYERRIREAWKEKWKEKKATTAVKTGSKVVSPR